VGKVLQGVAKGGIGTVEQKRGEDIVHRTPNQDGNCKKKLANPAGVSKTKKDASG